jgi:hypothetical protein
VKTIKNKDLIFKETTFAKVGRESGDGVGNNSEKNMFEREREEMTRN